MCIFGECQNSAKKLVTVTWHDRCTNARVIAWAFVTRSQFICNCERGTVRLAWFVGERRPFVFVVVHSDAEPVKHRVAVLVKVEAATIFCVWFRADERLVATALLLHLATFGVTTVGSSRAVWTLNFPDLSTACSFLEFQLQKEEGKLDCHWSD